MPASWVRVITASALVVGAFVAAPIAQAADSLSVTRPVAPAALPVTVGYVNTIQVAVTGSPTTILASSSDVAVVTVDASKAVVGGAATFEVRGVSQGTATITLDAGGGLTTTVSVTVSNNLGACADTDSFVVPPCIQSVEFKGTSVAAGAWSPAFYVLSSNLGIQAWALNPTGGADGDTVEFELNLGTNPLASQYFILGGGEFQSVSVVGGPPQIVTTSMQLKPWSIMMGSGAGPNCWVYNCVDNLVAEVEGLVANTVLVPVNAPGSGRPTVDPAFAGGYFFTNAGSSSLASFSGQMSFAVANPRFKRACPHDATTRIATNPQDCIGSGLRNSGYFDAFIPQTALDTVFNLPQLNASACWVGGQMSDACADLLNIKQSPTGSGAEIDRSDTTTFSFANPAGLRITNRSITFSSSNISISPAPASGGGGGTGGGGSGGGGSGGGAAASAETAAAPQPIATPAPVATTQEVLAPAANPVQAAVNSVASLAPTDIQQLSPSQLAALPPQAFAVMSPAQVKALNPEQVGGITPQQISAIPAEALRAMKPKTLRRIPVASIRALTGEQAQGLRSRQLKALGPIKRQIVLNKR